MKAAAKKTPRAASVPGIDARESANDAFQRLLPIFHNNAHAACERFNASLRTNEVRLWVDDSAVVDPNFFTTHLRVAARPAEDGRWNVKIEAIRALERAPDEYSWAVSSHDVDALARRVDAESKRHAGGPKPKYLRDEVLIEGAAVLQKFGRNIPPNYSTNDLMNEVGANLGDRSPGDTLLKEILGPLLKRLKSNN